MSNQDDPQEINRRQFLKHTSQAAFFAMMGGVELRAADGPASSANPEAALTAVPPPKTVNFAVIGAGTWGREIISTIQQLETSGVHFGNLVAVCDTHKPTLKRVKDDLAPKADTFSDYKEILARSDVDAVVVATPSHKHREIVEAALAANKHVYCEAPLAVSVDEAKAIATAAKKAVKVVFQAGLQERSHPQRHFLVPFIRSGALGRNVMTRIQWHKKTSWAKPGSDDMNWRLHRDTSAGLIGENCIHMLDSATWFLHQRPKSVSGFNSMILWGDDNREIPDTVMADFELTDGSRLVCDATLCSSFEDQYEMYYGTDSSILYRDSKAWMFQEADAPNYGWIVYARKDTFGNELGVALVANASKQSALGKDAISAPAFPHSSLYYALEAFAINVGTVRDTVKDFIDSYGDSDLKGLQDNLAGLKLQPAANWQNGYEATVLCLKANEATLTRQKITLEKDLFDI